MNDEELLRYSRQIMLPEIEISGQEKLAAARVLILGMGGLGSPVAIYLTTAGVGHLTLVDHDVVDLSNLQRQVLHGEADLNRPKVESAADTLRAYNPALSLHLINQKLSQEQLEAELTEIDLVVDATDNFATRFITNDACRNTNTPLVSGAAIRLEGQLMVYDPRDPEKPCYRCLYQDASDDGLNCAENGVAAPVVGIIGTMQAMEAVKLICGFGESLAGYLLVFDAKYADWRKLKLPKNPACPGCGKP